LDLSQCTMSYDGLMHITGLKNLRVINLRNFGDGVNYDGMEHLSHLTQLMVMKLNCNKNNIDQRLDFLTHLTNMEEMELSGVKSIEGIEIHPLVKLRKLSFSVCSLPHEVYNLSNLTQLRMIEFRFTNIDIQGINNLRIENPQLEELYFIYCEKIGIEEVKTISYFYQLKKLSLASCDGVTSEGIINLSRLEKLEMLDLHGCVNITAEGFKYISLLKNLTDLNVEKCFSLEYGVIDYISGLQNLKILDISYCSKLSPTSIIILKIPSLKQLKRRFVL